MPVRIKANTKEMDEIFANFQKFTETTIPILVRRHSRLLAVELAARTQPFSVGAKGKEAQITGQRAVKNDLNKVFRSQETLQGIIDKTTSEGLKTKLQKLLDAGKYKQLGEVFKAVGLASQYQMVSKGELSAIHKYNRSRKTGRTKSPRKNMFIATTGFATYIKEIQRRVGLSKAAWADCARQIGGIKGDGARGIPAFGKSSKHPKSGAIIDGIKKRNPFVTMKSDLPWASRILPDKEIKFAHKIVRDKMIKQADMMVRHAAKKNFQPEPPDNE